MGQRFYNNARGVLAGPVIDIDDTIVLQDHANLPTSLAPGDWFSLTILNETSRYGSNVEIVKVTGVSLSGAYLELVVERGQDGTATVAHDLGEKAEARITRMSIEALLAEASSYTDGEISALLDSAPGALDTLNELAAALGDDPDFAATVTNALADIHAETILRKTSDNGAAVLPAGTTLQRPSGNGPFLRYNTEQETWEGSADGITWGSIGGGATGSGGNAVFVENDQVVTGDYTIPGTKNAMTTGPVTIADGVTVTISDGARWVII